jgi:hypothetical protein
MSVRCEETALETAKRLDAPPKGVDQNLFGVLIDFDS